MTDQDYDLVVIGSGPGGQKAALNAAKLGKVLA
jgi:NAD(P) transhydrogenase